ncbi:MAG: hypothetical protein ACO30M_03355, partial [Candidatus Kapaibacteriota bacterium]
MRIVLYHLTCFIMTCGIFGNHHAIAKSRTCISEKEKGESISGVETEKILVFDTQMIPFLNPNRVNSDNGFIQPGDYLVVKIRSLHNQLGDFLCSFKVYTNLADTSNNVPDSIANPVFTLRGNVRNTEVDIFDQGCNYY